MTTLASFGDVGAARRIWLVCGAVSIGLHALLLLSGKTGGSSATELRDASSEIRVALVGVAQGVDTHAQTAPEMPARLTPSVAPIGAYPKLLAFSPVELPPPKFDEADYQPLNKLTVPPTAAQEISIAYPHDPDRAGLLVTALTLFIDEDGSVAKVRVGEPRAPASYEQAAVDAFSKARFNPGLSGQRPVKARMVIRVAFESSAASGPISSRGIRFK